MTSLQPVHDLLARKREFLVDAKRRQADLSREIQAATEEVRKLEEGLNNCGSIALNITDHAIARYAERVLGFEISNLAQLVREKVEPFALVLGDGHYPLVDGFKAVVQGNRVVTIVPE